MIVRATNAGFATPRSEVRQAIWHTLVRKKPPRYAYVTPASTLDLALLITLPPADAEVFRLLGDAGTSKKGKSP